MGYKMKPIKAVLKRFRFSKTGKVKMNRTKTSHLRSSRTGNLKRRLRRASIMYEGLAKRMRALAVKEKVSPAKVAARRQAKALAAAAAGNTEQSDS